MTIFTNILFLVSCLLFVISIHALSSPKTAFKGNLIGMLGMCLSIIAGLTLLNYSNLLPTIIITGMGGIIGIYLSQKIKITSLPQMIALLNSFGGLSALLIALSEHNSFSLNVFLSLIVGGITFSGSITAFLKLQNIISSKPAIFPFQKSINISIFLFIIFLCAISQSIQSTSLLYITSLLIICLGTTITLPIGGADMPIAISLLNAFSGWATVIIGFSFQSTILIIVGSIVGCSGTILTLIMTKSMNRSLYDVLNGKFSTLKTSASFSDKPARAGSPADAAFIMENSSKIIIVPGFGMAVAQAQYALKEMAQILEDKYNVEVKFAIHPVAGRMPGHMNVLLAEASVDYTKVFDLQAINNEFSITDVAYVIGANDITNPLAQTDHSSPIYGMPILEVYKAKNVFFVKRSLGEGYSGIPNPLFYADNTTMLYGDAKEITEQIINYLA